MNKKLNILFIAFLCNILMGCLEKVELEQGQYVKVLGKEGTSVVEKMIELNNGDIMILGKMGVAAHDVSSVYVGSEVGEVEDLSPFIAITDPNGNIKKLKLYPIEDFSLRYGKVLNPQNKSIFKDIVALSSGGYVVLGQLFDFDFEMTIPGVPTIVDYSVPGDFNFAPFIVHLDDQLNMTSMRSFNLTEDWDVSAFRIGGVLKQLPNNELGLLLARKVDLVEGEIGYTFLKMDQNLDTLEVAEDFDNQNGKYAYDFTVDDLGNINILGTESNQFNIYQLPISDMKKENERKVFVDADGTFNSFNRNEHYISTLADGSILTVYNLPPREITVSIFSQGLQNLRKFSVTQEMIEPGSIRAIRAIHEMTNGDLLIFLIQIPPNSKPVEGFLYRYTPNGELVFEHRVDGTPGDVIETADGHILMGYNAQYNGLLQRINLMKIDEQGNLY